MQFYSYISTCTNSLFVTRKNLLGTKLLMQDEAQLFSWCTPVSFQSSGLSSCHSNIFECFCFIYPLFSATECNMESYREQAIQLPGIGKRVGVPGNAMNTGMLTDYCLQEKERKKCVTFFKLLCMFRDRHKTISFEKTVYTKIKKIQPASSSACRKFREQVLLALNLKYAHSSHEFSVPNEWETQLQHLRQYCSCKIHHTDVLLVNLKQNADICAFIPLAAWLQPRAGCAGAIPQGRHQQHSSLKTNPCPSAPLVLSETLGIARQVGDTKAAGLREADLAGEWEPCGEEQMGGGMTLSPQGYPRAQTRSLAAVDLF